MAQGKCRSMSNVNRPSRFIEHVLKIETVHRLSGDIKGYVRAWDHYTDFGTIVGEDHRIYRLNKRDLLSYDAPSPYQRVVFQRDLKGTGDVAMNVRLIKW